MAYAMPEGNGPVRVLRDGQPVSPVLPGVDDAFAWLQRHQSMSVDWAMRHEGYAVEKVPAEPWPDDAADRHGRQQLRAMAENVLRHEHPPVGSAAFREWAGGTDEGIELVRDNCHACALLDGWGEIPAAESKTGHHEPNGAFPRTHIEAGRPIPRRWAAALVWYLNSDHNPGHRDALARDLATWGVRYTD